MDTEFCFIAHPEDQMILAKAYPIPVTGNECMQKEEGFVCTRAFGHLGVHVSHMDDSHVTAIWEDHECTPSLVSPSIEAED